MSRILIGILAPLIVIFIAWSVGDIPAKSIFWKTDNAEITGHESFEFDSGFGPAIAYFPRIELAGKKAIRLNVPDRHGEAKILKTWPVGTRLSVRLHPNGKTAYPKDDPRLNLVIPIIIALGGLSIIGFAFRSMLTKGGGMDLLLGGIGSAFVAVASLLFFALWTFGMPPATSWFWPTETVTVASSKVDSGPIGNGNTNWFPIVSVTRADSNETKPLEIVRNVFMSEAEASKIVEEYAPGTRHSVRVAPDDRLFERYWQFQFTLAIVISFLSPILALAGLFVIFMALRSSKS